MSFATALDLAAAFIGLASGMFFCVGVLHVKDSTLEIIATSMWGKGVTIATELAQQKSDFIFGAALLFLSFLVQVVSRLLAPETAAILVASSQLSGVALSLGVPTAVLCVFYIPWRQHRKRSAANIAALAEGKV